MRELVPATQLRARCSALIGEPNLIGAFLARRRDHSALATVPLLGELSDLIGSLRVRSLRSVFICAVSSDSVWLLAGWFPLRPRKVVAVTDRERFRVESTDFALVVWFDGGRLVVADDWAMHARQVTA